MWAFAFAAIWFFSAIIYFFGQWVTAEALVYIKEHYRGYDDFAPPAADSDGEEGLFQ